MDRNSEFPAVLRSPAPLDLLTCLGELRLQKCAFRLVPSTGAHLCRPGRGSRKKRPREREEREESGKKSVPRGIPNAGDDANGLPAKVAHCSLEIRRDCG